MPGLAWLGDRTGRRTFFNRRWLDFTGRSERDESGVGWLRGLPHEDQQRYLAALAAAADQGRALRICYRLQGRDGQPHVVIEEAQPRLSRNGRLVGYAGLCLEAETPADDRAPHLEADDFRALAGRLEAAREEERARLARELHDELGQVLTSTKLDLMWLCEQVRLPGARPSLPLVNRLQSLVGLVELGIATVQQITTDLRPPMLDHLGLEAALEWEATKFHARTGIRCRLDARLGPVRVDPQHAIALFRITQESLTNVARHAHAGAARITLRRQRGRLVLEVHDNGRGIAGHEVAAARAAGLFGMRERAHALGGDFCISGRPGRGTRVIVSIPERAVES